MYYHIIEEGDFGNLGWHGYKDSQEDAQKEVDRLKNFYPDLHFYVYPDPLESMPVFITC